LEFGLLWLRFCGLGAFSADIFNILFGRQDSSFEPFFE
jgi:hypothetical protein